MIAIIGCGNMAQAIVKGFYAKNNDANFLTYTPSFTRAQELAHDVKGRAAKELKDLSKATTFIIACKPQQLGQLATELMASEVDLADKHIISILAATPLSVLQNKLAAKRVTRIMPNTPCLIGKGLSLVIHSKEVTEEEKQFTKKFFSACGDVELMPSEILFDQVTTVSGSGPAYVYLFAKTMADKLVSWGLDDRQAKSIAIQLFRGSSDLMQRQQELSFDELIAKVTSKKGVTIEAVESYQKQNISQMSSKALDAAFNRSEEIKKELNSL